MDNELLNEIHMVKNHSSNTKRIYKIAVEKYTSFFSMSLSELLEEAELEEDQGIKWKKRKVKRKILTYRQHLIDNYTLSTVKTMLSPILSIYKYYEIELVDIPQINKKAVNKPDPITFKEESH